MIVVRLASLADELDLIDPRIVVLHPILSRPHCGSAALGKSQRSQDVYRRQWEQQRRDCYHRLNGRSCQ